MSERMLSSLRARGIQVWVERGVLRVGAPVGVVTNADIEALSTNSMTIIEALRQHDRQAWRKAIEKCPYAGVSVTFSTGETVQSKGRL